MRRTCPGLSNLLRPKPQYITCLGCGGDVEIWTDEDEAECAECRTKVSWPMQSCLEWCEYASKCKKMIAQEKGS